MATFTSHSPEETFRLGEELGQRAEPGWVYGLTGELGAGKTQLVQGIARGLGLRRRIPSPTFGLVHEHHGGRLPLFHLDLYRLETTREILAAGLEPYFTPSDAIAVIEWYERWQGPRPPRLCRIQFLAVADVAGLRTIEYAHDPPRD